jgi:hypothetical protein
LFFQDAAIAGAGAMFSLFYGLWKYMFNKDELRVLILGVDKAGKTVIALRLYLFFSPDITSD